MSEYIVIQNSRNLPGATGRERYAAFCATEFWKQLSSRVRSEAGKCADCGRNYGLEAHHRFYRKNWFETEETDLIVLCRECHERRHAPGAKKIKTIDPNKVRWSGIKKQKLKKRRNRNRNKKSKAAKRDAWLANQSWKRRHWSF